mmetsp:Transcript_26660/g.50393  ORF Transcript_26660/g.50393 Transcript_26660/m.50393 type:complete len:235 (+) Transcript_26660:406-1110(+)
MHRDFFVFLLCLLGSPKRVPAHGPLQHRLPCQPGLGWHLVRYNCEMKNGRLQLATSHERRAVAHLLLALSKNDVFHLQARVFLVLCHFRFEPLGSLLRRLLGLELAAWPQGAAAAVCRGDVLGAGEDPPRGDLGSIAAVLGEHLHLRHHPLFALGLLLPERELLHGQLRLARLFAPGLLPLRAGVRQRRRQRLLRATRTGLRCSDGCPLLRGGPAFLSFWWGNMSNMRSTWMYH